MKTKLGLLLGAVLLAGASVPSYAADRTSGSVVRIAITSHHGDHDDHRSNDDHRRQYVRAPEHRGRYVERREVRYVTARKPVHFHPAPQRQIVYVNHRDHHDHGRHEAHRR